MNSVQIRTFDRARIRLKVKNISSYTRQTRSVASQTQIRKKSTSTSSFGLGLGPLPRDISSPSFGHLVSSLSATTPQMIVEGVRTPGQTMDEEQRTYARRVVLALLGTPFTLGTGILGWKWMRIEQNESTE